MTRTIDGSTVLHHLTLTTGHLAVTLRSEVTDETIDRLLPIVRTDGGYLPEVDLYIDIWRHPAQASILQGVATFQISSGSEPMSTSPLVFGTCCWRPELSDEAWGLVLDSYHMFSLPLATSVRDAPELPWVAVALSPMILRELRRRLIVLGDLERCLAWALIEAGG